MLPKKNNRLWHIITIVVMGMVISGCSTQESVLPVENSNLVSNPESNATTEPIMLNVDASIYYLKSADKSSVMVENILQAYWKESGVKTRPYFYQYFDLNKDGSNEVFILIHNVDKNKTDYTLLVVDDQQRLIGEMEPWTPPVIIGQAKDNTYAPLFLSVGKGSYLKIPYDGKGYSLKSAEKEYTDFSELKGIGLLSDVLQKKGFKLN